MEKESDKYKFRINIFSQLNEFYRIVFNAKYKLSTSEIALYMFLLNQNNRLNWVEWMKVPFDLVLNGSGIGSNVTYYKALHKLQEYRLIDYIPGINKSRTCVIRIIKLTKTKQVNIPQSKPLSIVLSDEVNEALFKELPEVLPAHIYNNLMNKFVILINSNLKEIKDNNYSLILRKKF